MFQKIVYAKYDGPSNAREQFAQIWPGGRYRRSKDLLFDPKCKVHLFENSLLKILA